MPLTEAAIIDGGDAVSLAWADGARARFHAIWLRDNALDAETRSPANGQRLVTVLDVPADTAVASASVGASGDLQVRFAPDGHETRFPAAWLAERIYDTAVVPSRGWAASDLTLWDGGLQAAIPCADFQAIRDDRRALGRWLAAVRRYGFALLSGAEPRSGALCTVAALFGYVRETNYGTWFDVRSEVNPSNLAYTNLGLQAHTDNPYRDPVPTMQILHCLENGVDGGDSMVVDGFAIARRLRDEAPAAFDLLAGHCARFEYAGSKGVRLRAKRPMLELGPDGELIAVRFNNRSAAAFTDIPYARMADFYAAYRRFAALVEDPAQRVTFRLDPGMLFIVDNTRVLHARTRFSGTGTRWLQGCYPDKDGLLSTLASIEEEFGERGV